MQNLSNENANRSLDVTGESDIAKILVLKGLRLDLARYIVLQTYKGCGVDTLKSGEYWLFSHPDFYPLNDGKETWNACAKNGHLEIVKILHENRTEGCTTWAMDKAATNGQLEVVKWLHENRTEGCTAWTMNSAAENGHLEVLKFLHENRNEGYTAWAMNRATSNGHLEVAKWLHENYNKKGKKEKRKKNKK